MNKNNNLNICDFKVLVFDFDGVFTDNKVYVGQDGSEFVQCSRADGLAFDLLKRYIKMNNLNLEFFVLSSECNSVVLERAKKLNIVAHTSVKNKLKFIQNYLQLKFPDTKNPFNYLAYLGKDLNDLSVMRLAGLSIAPSDSHPMVKSIATKVYPQIGGNGFIRSFIEDFIKINNLTEGQLDELISNC
jgi:N-acylneuraminate cytidylyltransferase